MLTENEKLNASYIVKLKEWYQWYSGEGLLNLKFSELERAIQDFSKDIEMYVDREFKSQAFNKVIDLI